MKSHQVTKPIAAASTYAGTICHRYPSMVTCHGTVTATMSPTPCLMPLLVVRAGVISHSPIRAKMRISRVRMSSLYRPVGGPRLVFALQERAAGAGVAFGR